MPVLAVALGRFMGCPLRATPAVMEARQLPTAPKMPVRELANPNLLSRSGRAPRKPGAPS
jgi:hypothetical protein